MKKWLYLILPAIMTVVFGVFYVQHEKDVLNRESTRSKQISDKMNADKALKDAAEAKAKESAKITQAEREAADAKREAGRKAQQDAVDGEIKENTDKSIAEAEESAKKTKILEAELDLLQKNRDRLGREAFDLAKGVEHAMVAKRNAELEEQRLTEMIARKAAESAMAKIPPPPPPPPPKG
ncbi:MAG: hypothetical protein EXS38_03365 [Opitutus sp.]|nr:hypothetical protein [Opitutus sp.]